jgi:hypothetical protein
MRETVGVASYHCHVSRAIEDSFDTSRWEPVDPGWGLDELIDLDPAELGERDAVLAISAVAKAEAMLHVARLDLLHALAARKAANRDADAEWIADVVAAELNVSIPQVANDLGFAEQLTEALPETLRQLRAGRIDVARAHTIGRLVTGLTDEQCRELERVIYPRAATVKPRSLSALVKREVIRLDPHAAETQHRAAKAERRVCVEPAPHGMSWLNAYLPADDVCAISHRIEMLARQVTQAGDARSFDQVRADVLRDLLLGDGSGGGKTTTVYVTVSAETLLGLDDLPGELRGYGPLSAAQVRELAYSLKATWSGVLVDAGGYPKKLADKRYRFAGKLAEYIRLRDQYCTFPGCAKPADKCDLDHRIPHPDGETSANNGQPECRRHHRLKTHSEWTVRKTTDGTITWTSPTGRQLTTEPEPLQPPEPQPPPREVDEPPPF